jgi:hypothetical protein
MAYISPALSLLPTLPAHLAALSFGDASYSPSVSASLRLGARLVSFLSVFLERWPAHPKSFQALVGMRALSFPPVTTHM